MRMKLIRQNPIPRISREIPRPRLSHDTVTVVSFPIDQFACDSDAVALLDEGERARAARFVHDRDRRRYAGSHAGVRLIIGACLRRPAASIRFQAGAHGKPRLDRCDIDLRFNLAHSGGEALLAMTLGRDVGVDVEQTTRKVDALEVARSFFSPGERAYLASLAGDARADAFFRIWVRKEALVKAVGRGLAMPLGDFEVLGHDVAAGRFVQVQEDGDARVVPSNWTVQAVDAPPGYVAAVAAEGSNWAVRAG
jgi:4'-phosphopantetheinyl transferase